ncbi:MAG: nucleotidyl transferase AbiEii/AbiGii toxin family protein [Patescibacteria group bacterium]
MFTDQIPSWTQQLMGILSPVLPEKTYLAGGTALALHLNHRTSYDLDLYSPNEFTVPTMVVRLEKSVPEFRLVSTGWQTILGGSKDTEISLFYYQYPLLENTTHFNDLPIASLADLACMKLEAISNRGLKRDFFDLYTICQLDAWNLSQVLKLTIKKYQRQASDVPHLLKSLVYFEDAEKLPERAQIVDKTWEQVKTYFEIETKQLFKEI